MVLEEKLPRKIAIFPLSNAIFFPRTILPLNIFEERYIQLVNDCMKENRIFGMVQPKTKIDKIPEVTSRDVMTSDFHENFRNCF